MCDWSRSRSPTLPALSRISAGDRSTFCLTWVPDGEQDAERYIAAALADQEAGTAVPFATTRMSDGEVVGSTRFMNIERWTWDNCRAEPRRRRDRLDLADAGCTAHSDQHRGEAAHADARVRRVERPPGDVEDRRTATSGRATRSSVSGRSSTACCGPTCPRTTGRGPVTPPSTASWRASGRMSEPASGQRWASPTSTWAHDRFEPMFVLGIDPGLSRCGYAADRRARRPRPCAPRSECSRRSPPIRCRRRLAELRGELSRLIAEVQPDVVVVEHVFFQVNVRTAMSVGQASGLALAEAATGWLRGRAVHAEPGEGGGRRLRRGDEGAGATPGAGTAEPRDAPEPARRRRCRGTGAVPSRLGTVARAAGARG